MNNNNNNNNITAYQHEGRSFFGPVGSKSQQPNLGRLRNVTYNTYIYVCSRETKVNRMAFFHAILLLFICTADESLACLCVYSSIQDPSGVDVPVLSEAAAEDDSSRGVITFFSWAMPRI